MFKNKMFYYFKDKINKIPSLEVQKKLEIQ